jgi:protocatechuate 3,4-dioxygenase beta subunit
MFCAIILSHMSFLQGAVVDDKGHPVENATITVPAAKVFALSDENGQFMVEGIPPGLYTVYVVHRNFQKLGGNVDLSGDTFVTFEMDQ